MEKQNMTRENIYKAIEILLKATTDPIFQNYISEEKIEEAYSNIIICHTNEAFLKQVDSVIPNASKEDPSVHGMKAFQAVESKKIVFRNNCSIETVVHELVHYFSLDGKTTGILGIGLDLIADKDNPNWDNLFDLHIGVLNEAMTRYITQELLPENKIEDAYSYGAKFLKDYADASGNMNQIFDAYFKKDKQALDFIATDVNKEGIISWHDILDVSGVHQYTQMQIFRNYKKNFQKCADERKRIDVLIQKINDRKKSTQELGKETSDMITEINYIDSTENSINLQQKEIEEQKEI